MQRKIRGCFVGFSRIFRFILWLCIDAMRMRNICSLARAQMPCGVAMPAAGGAGRGSMCRWYPPCTGPHLVRTLASGTSTHPAASTAAAQYSSRIFTRYTFRFRPPGPFAHKTSYQKLEIVAALRPHHGTQVLARREAPPTPSFPQRSPSSARGSHSVLDARERARDGG